MCHRMGYNPCNGTSTGSHSATARSSGAAPGVSSQPPTRVASARMSIMVLTAFSASGPAARTVTCCPLVAPSPMTASTLLASARLAPTVSSTADSKAAAATASDPAGRAWRSPASVTVTVTSQLSGMTCLLARAQHRLDVPAGGGGDGGRDRALHERGIRDGDRLGEILGFGEQRADREHRAAQVGQDHHAGPGIGERERALDLGDAGRNAAVDRAAGGGDGHSSTTDLPGELGGSLGQRGAVRDEDDPYLRFVSHALS